jgi:hypothetical protein
MSEGEDFSDLVPEGVKKVVGMYNLTEKLKNCHK